MMRFTKYAQRNMILAGFGIGFLLLSFVLDKQVLAIAASLHNSVLSYFFRWISYIISLVIVLLIMTSLFMWEENKKDWIIPLWFSCVCATIVTYAIKFMVMRERPEEIVYILGFQDYSFPSGHAAFTFSTIPILDEEYPHIKWFWISFGILVAISRLYLELHYLSDIIAGIMIGYAIGATIVYLKRKHSLFG